MSAPATPGVAASPGASVPALLVAPLPAGDRDPGCAAWCAAAARLPLSDWFALLRRVLASRQLALAMEMLDRRAPAMPRQRGWRSRCHAAPAQQAWRAPPQEDI
jgi:hypothetical protein